MESSGVRMTRLFIHSGHHARITTAEQNVVGFRDHRTSYQTNCRGHQYRHHRLLVFGDESEDEGDNLGAFSLTFGIQIYHVQDGRSCEKALGSLRTYVSHSVTLHWVENEIYLIPRYRGTFANLYLSHDVLTDWANYCVRKSMGVNRPRRRA